MAKNKVCGGIVFHLLGSRSVSGRVYSARVNGQRIGDFNALQDDCPYCNDRRRKCPHVTAMCEIQIVTLLWNLTVSVHRPRWIS